MVRLPIVPVSLDSDASLSLEFSVVIPARNARRTLPEVLSALAGQTDAPSFEVVVVDDGSTDGGVQELADRSFPMPLRTLQNAGDGSAAARNAGVAVAGGERVALLGADTVPDTGWLRAHAAAHHDRGDPPELAVLGLIRPHRRLRRTPFLEVIHRNGLQFGYPLIEDPENLPFNFFYSSNISLSTELLLDNPFDPSFPDAAFEDTELGYRLVQNGIRLVYAAEALVEHDHAMTLTSFARRQERSGFAAAVFHSLHPEIAPFLGIGSEGPPPALGWLGRLKLAVLTRGTGRLPWRALRLWEAILGHHYLIGLNRGWRARLEGSDSGG